MIKDFYDKIGGSYEDAKSRLMTDRIIEKFVLKFPADPTYKELSEAVDAKDWDKAFVSVHTLKGVALNLSFAVLGEKASLMTETLRENCRAEHTEAEFIELYKAVSDAYQTVITEIKTLL